MCLCSCVSMDVWAGAHPYACGSWVSVRSLPYHASSVFISWGWVSLDLEPSVWFASWPSCTEDLVSVHWAAVPCRRFCGRWRSVFWSSGLHSTRPISWAVFPSRLPGFNWAVPVSCSEELHQHSDLFFFILSAGYSVGGLNGGWVYCGSFSIL